MEEAILLRLKEDERRNMRMFHILGLGEFVHVTCYIYNNGVMA